MPTFAEAAMSLQPEKYLVPKYDTVQVGVYRPAVR